MSTHYVGKSCLVVVCALQVIWKVLIHFQCSVNSEIPVGSHVFDPESSSQFVQRSHLHHLHFPSVISTKECSKYANVSITQSLFLLIMSPLTLRCMSCERLSLLPGDLYIYMSGWTLRNERCIQTRTEREII